MTGLVGGIEAGGTKFVCAVGTGPADVRAEARFATTTPAETIARVIRFFRERSEELGRLAAVGIGSFGPVDLDPDSPTYGAITSTPKEGWADVDIVGRVSEGLAVPVAFDTDVNAAALGEWRWGAAKGLDSFIYLTVGTGIGGGGLVNGKPMHGLTHPEMGHVRVPRVPRDAYPGRCPYHGDCLEGLAAAPAVEERWGKPLPELPAKHPAWELEADYLALGLVNFICTLSPRRIVIGGGVMERRELYPLIRRRVQDLLNDYVRVPAVGAGIDDYIVAPELGRRAGVLGAVALAQDSLASH